MIELRDGLGEANTVASMIDATDPQLSDLTRVDDQLFVLVAVHLGHRIIQRGLVEYYLTASPRGNHVYMGQVDFRRGIACQDQPFSRSQQ